MTATDAICSTVHEAVHDRLDGALLPWAAGTVIEVSGEELWDFVLERLKSKGVDLSRDCRDEKTAKHILKTIQLLVAEALVEQCRYDWNVFSDGINNRTQN